MRVKGRQLSFRTDRVLPGLLTIMLIISLPAFLPAVGHGADNEPNKTSASEAPTTATSEVGSESASTGKTEAYVSLSILGSNPVNRPLKLNGDEFPQTSLGGGLGAGIKAGAYAGFTGGILGFEGEIFGFTGDITVPQTTVNGVTRSATSRLNVLNAMANVLLRYPGEFVQPYVGVGAGLSGGFLRNANIQNSQQGSVIGKAGDGAFAVQFLAGIRANVSEHVYLFTEYKYFAANYKWESELGNGADGPSPSLHLRTHIVAGGVGFRF